MTNKEWTDDEILSALILRDKNWTMKDVGLFLGRTRNSVIGQLNRVHNESEKHE